MNQLTQTDPARQPRPPVIVIANQATAQQPRLSAKGWFDRSFAAASGVLAAYFLFIVLPPLVIVASLLVVAFVIPAMFPEPTWQPRPPVVEQGPTLGTADAAKQHALNFLRKHGVDYLAKDCAATFISGQWRIEGDVIKEGGAVAPALVLVEVTQDGNTLRWKITDAKLGDWWIARGH